MHWIKLNILLVTCLVALACADITPILIWGGEDGKTTEYFSLFEKTTKEQLDDVVKDKMGNEYPPIVIFYKDNLCIEDFKRHQQNLIKLKEYKSPVFIPEFQSTLSYFRGLPGYNQSTEDFKSISDGETAFNEITDFDGISDRFDTVKNLSPNSIGVLTGRHCKNSKTNRRPKREATTEAPADNTTDHLLINSDPRILLYAERTPFLHLINQEKNIDLGEPTVSFEGDGILTTLVVSMVFTPKDAGTYNVSLEIAPGSDGYYSLTNAVIVHNDESNNATTLLPRLQLSWPRNFSYHCSNFVTFGDREKTMILEFENLQVQMFTNKFSDAYDCTGFTTIPIWTAIFVTFLLAAIMMIGIYMLMNIRTMDRFDDPKGKTITVSAQE